MAAENAKDDAEVGRLPTDSEDFEWQGWKFKYTKSHILHSICSSPEKCKSTPEEQCCLCLYTNCLQLSHLPEMVFPKNILTISHPSGGKIEFNTLDALKSVENGKLPIQVACSEEWKESRLAEHLEEKIKPFDWTFSTNYKGTLSEDAVVEPTEETIDMEMLKRKEKILFYNEMMLYEDELHDNGISSLTVKIRVMPSSFFILQRFFLRVDGVLVRINDTRVFHDFTKDFVIREFTNKECAVKDIKLPLTLFGDPNMLSPHMPLKSSTTEKITFRIK
ncbi:TIP41-like protein isoform X1 [Anthonomus grandis grandis]|uniref:TIP41-like protein isoform X1 n=1 Tax=Anthonomus grandis grandis TaxID=2921223 RepID=UPI00216619AE|nr:TIP41-like protein isoform X1 [Anthonomus grandis grandis]